MKPLRQKRLKKMKGITMSRTPKVIYITESKLYLNIQRFWFCKDKIIYDLRFDNLRITNYELQF